MSKYSFKKTLVVIVIFFASFQLLVFISAIFLSVSSNKFSAKYIVCIENNRDEIGLLFRELDSIKAYTDSFNLNYHLNLNELYFKDKNKENEFFIYNKENEIKKLLSKYSIESFNYLSENNESIKVSFRKVTLFGTSPDNLFLYFHKNNNGIDYYFVHNNDTILFKNISFVPRGTNE